jgi:oligopeptide transport system permease protein
MLTFILRRILRGALVLLGVALAAFFLMRAIPGNPWANYLDSTQARSGSGIDLLTLKELNRQYGLDLPAWRQFGRYVVGHVEKGEGFSCGAICGNLGPSFRYRGRSVVEVLFEPPEDTPSWKSRFGYSLRLILLATLFAAGVGIPLGIFIATRPAARSRRAVSFGLAAVISVPSFALGLLVIVILASELKLISVLPDWDDPVAWLAPAIVLGLAPMAGIARVTRASLLQVIGEDYVRTARAKGLSSGRVMRVHVMRSALIPIITFMGPALLEMFTGLLVVESLYGFPGIGREFWQAVLALDYPMILGLTILYASAIILVTMIIEIVAEMTDPRLRLAAERSAP